ncbi:hypothetical protein [Wolbachia endosymbiont of Dactylopius coccus]
MFIWLNYHFFSPSSYFLSTEPRISSKNSRGNYKETARDEILTASWRRQSH